LVLDADAFVCVACEKDIDDLSVWKFQQRYRTEVASVTPHTILHSLIRFGVKTAATTPVKEDIATLKHLELVENRMTKRLDEVEARLARIESLLEAHPRISNGI
jgi:hypothetical protein